MKLKYLQPGMIVTESPDDNAYLYEVVAVKIDGGEKVTLRIVGEIYTFAAYYENLYFPTMTQIKNYKSKF